MQLNCRILHVLISLLYIISIYLQVVEVYFLNEMGQYLQVELSPLGQYFVLLFGE